MKEILKRAIIVIVVLFILHLALSSLFKETPTYTPLLSDQDHVKGDINAESEIIEYSDFECPFCGNFYRDTLPSIESEFIDTGKAKLIFKHFPLSQIHRFAWKAAEASECAADQGKFWEYHNILFERQQKLAINDLKSYASELNLNTTLFNVCLDSGVMSDRVKADFNEGVRNRVSSTPNFFLNGIKIEGAQSFSVFENALS